MKTTTIISRPSIMIYWMTINSILFFAICIMLLIAKGNSLADHLDDIGLLLGFCLFLIAITIPLWKSQLTIFSDDTIHIKSWWKDYQFKITEIESFNVEHQAGHSWLIFMRITFKDNTKYFIWKPLGWTKFDLINDFISDARDRIKYPKVASK